MKFQRTYVLTFHNDEKNPEATCLTVKYPLTCKFSLDTSWTASANRARFQIINLGAESRALLYRDLFDFGRSYFACRFSAGYENEPSIPLVFKGDVKRASSYRQGPDWITEIEAFDGHRAMQRAQVDLTIDKHYSVNTVLKQMAATLKPFDVAIGQIGEFPTQSSRAKSMSGNTWDLMVRLMAQYGTQPSISKGVLNVVGQDQYIADAGQFTELTSDTGLLGTPRVSGAYVTAQMIFEPRIEHLQQLSLVTQEARLNERLKSYSSQKVMAIGHTGVISGAVGGSAITTVTFILSGLKQAVAA